MDHPTRTELQGQYVVLRPLRIEDAELTLRWRRGARGRLLNPGAASLFEQTRWIAARPKGEFNFIVELRSGQPVGMLSLINIDNVNRRAEPARFLIGEPDSIRGMPVAIEAMLLLYELVFDHLDLRRVYGTVAADNRLMVKWQKYLGMKEEGRLRQHYFLDGRVQDAVCLGMLEEEYREIALPRMRALVASTHLKDTNAETQGPA